MIDHFISVIVAVKNEEKYIEKCLLSLINQDFPRNSYQIIVVDGISTDRTVDIVNKYQLIYGDFIRQYNNPKEWQAAGRNLAIQKAKSSDLVAYIDGHCIADKDWLKGLYDVLLNSDKNVAGVGSVISSPPDESNFGKAIDRVFSTVLGAAGTSYIGKNRAMSVETVPFVLYRRKALLAVGLYDEDMRYGEDYSLNYKLRRAGYQLLVNPDSRVYYYKRKDLTSFYNQMYNYGVTKAVIRNKYPTSLKIIHYLPSLSLVVIVLVGLLGIIFYEAIYLFVLIIAAYLCLICAISIQFAIREKKWGYIVSIPTVYVVEHMGYGIGFIAGFRKQGWTK